jgi:hypothetical protein
VTAIDYFGAPERDAALRAIGEIVHDVDCRDGGPERRREGSRLRADAKSPPMTRGSVPLGVEPGFHEARAMFDHVERELRAAGAAVERRDPGTLTFRMPPLVRAPRLGPLALVARGDVSVVAGRGGPWRVRYELGFTRLRIFYLVVTAAVVVAGWKWPRTVLAGVLALVWAVGYGVPWLVATRRFRGLVERAARDALERRSRAAPPSAPPSPPSDQPLH